jgi:hypothetical protein
MLKDIDEEYRTTLINFAKHKVVMFAMAKLMKMKTIEQNKLHYIYIILLIKKHLIIFLIKRTPIMNSTFGSRFHYGGLFGEFLT